MSNTDNAADQNLDTGPDYTVSGGGTIYLVQPHHPEAAQFLRDHVDEEAQFLGDNLAVEHRYIEDFVQHLRDDGWIVEGE